MAHTRTPWELSGLGIWANSPWNTRIQIASVNQFSAMNGINSAAIAALIVRAGNAHEELVSAAMLGLSISESWINEHCTDEQREAAMLALEPIRVALAKTGAPDPTNALVPAFGVGLD